jgi:hypothetical protein
MMRCSTLVCICLLLAGSGTAHAQVITLKAPAMAAHDSLLARADTLRSQIERLAPTIKLQASRNAARRTTIAGFYTDGALERGKRRIAWRRTVIYSRSGSTRELFTAYYPGASKKLVMMQIRLHDQQLTWLMLQNYQMQADGYEKTPHLSGSYMARRYVRWNSKNFLLPAPALKP